MRQVVGNLEQGQKGNFYFFCDIGCGLRWAFLTSKKTNLLRLVGCRRLLAFHFVIR
jgi:hypothetical protein